jgi:hypothetical protein
MWSVKLLEHVHKVDSTFYIEFLRLYPIDAV